MNSTPAFCKRDFLVDADVGGEEAFALRALERSDVAIESSADCSEEVVDIDGAPLSKSIPFPPS